MLITQEGNYRAITADCEVKQRFIIKYAEWLGVLPTQISYRAVDLLIWQYRLVQAHELEKRVLRQCTGCFTEQFGLPRAHHILIKNRAGQPL